MALLNISVKVANFSAANRFEEIRAMPPASGAFELFNFFAIVIINPAAADATCEVTVLTLNNYS